MKKKKKNWIPTGPRCWLVTQPFISEISDLICESQPTTGFEVKVLQTKGRSDFSRWTGDALFKAHWDVMVVLKFWDIQIAWQENLSTVWKWKQSAGIAFQKWKGHASDVDEPDSRPPPWFLGLGLFCHTWISLWAAGFLRLPPRLILKRRDGIEIQYRQLSLSEKLVSLLLHLRDKHRVSGRPQCSPHDVSPVEKKRKFTSSRSQKKTEKENEESRLVLRHPSGQLWPKCSLSSKQTQMSP